MLRLLLLAAAAAANPTGAPQFPTDGNVNAFRNHGAEVGNAVNSVHTLTASDACYRVGQALEVTLSGTTPFNGFVVYGSDESKAIRNAGTFISTDPNAQSKADASGASFLTHTNPNAKTSVSFTWTPNDGVGDVVIWASLHLGTGVSSHGASLSLAECAGTVVTATATPVTVAVANATKPVIPTVAVANNWQVPPAVPRVNAGFNPGAISAPPQVPRLPQQPRQPPNTIAGWNERNVAQWVPPQARTAQAPPPQQPPPRPTLPQWAQPSNSVAGGCLDRAGQFECLLASFQKGRDHCTKDKAWSQANCAATCGFCGAAPPTTNNWGQNRQQQRPSFGGFPAASRAPFSGFNSPPGLNQGQQTWGKSGGFGGDQFASSLGQRFTSQYFGAGGQQLAQNSFGQGRQQPTWGQSPFGQQSLFGQQGSQSLFGQQGSQKLFGQQGGQALFGQQGLFAGRQGSFGQQPKAAFGQQRPTGSFPSFGQQSSSFGAQSNPFGAQNNPFGAQNNLFGAQNNPFGAQNNPFGAQTQRNPFGAQLSGAPPFGNSFGTGQGPPGFGQG